MITRRLSGKSFEDLLIEKGFLTAEKLQAFLGMAAKAGKGIEQVLVEAGIPEEKIVTIKAEYLNCEFMDLSTVAPPPADLLKQMNPAYAKNYRILPIKFDEGVLTIAMVEPRDFIAMDEVVHIYRGALFKIRDVRVVITTLKHLLSAISRFYAIPRDPKEEVGMGSILNQLAETYKPEVKVADIERENATENSAPIVKLTSKIIEDAFRKRTSDIHLEPAIDHLRVRYRVDGELTEVMMVPKYAQDALIARFKIMCDMRLDEKRQPQDGRIDFTKYNSGVEIDLRVSTIPTLMGEDMVMRILDKKSSILSLDMLGFSEYNLKLYREAISAPYGSILHVGPTGSGKTTALYAALKKLDTPDIKIVTAEDPVEYTLGGQIVQSNMNPAAGYTFAKALRAFMRHDPDIILIGEIRDLETAKTAVEAALTGHLVFSTLHTNDAIGTVTRLTEMGIEPYLVADSLLLVCAQRLLRRICNKCKAPYVATDEEIEASRGDVKTGDTLYKGKGCEVCEGSGYKGRTGIYEVLSMNSALRSLLIKEATTEELRKTAIETGMRTLRQDAIEKALAGATTLEEVISSTLAET